MGEKVPEEPEGRVGEAVAGVGRAALRGPDYAEHAGSSEFEDVDGLDELPISHGNDFRRINRRGSG